MSFWDDFRKFAVRGNALDLTVGVVVGGAFGKIVTSLVNDIVLPPIGLLLGKVDFSNLFLILGSGSYPNLAEAKKSGCSGFMLWGISELCFRFCDRGFLYLYRCPVAGEVSFTALLDGWRCSLYAIGKTSGGDSG